MSGYPGEGGKGAWRLDPCNGMKTFISLYVTVLYPYDIHIGVLYIIYKFRSYVLLDFFPKVVAKMSRYMMRDESEKFT